MVRILAPLALVVCVMFAAPAMAKAALPDTTIIEIRDHDSAAFVDEDGSGSETVRMSFTGTGASRFQCQRDSGGWVRCSSPRTVRVRVGDHTLRVRAVNRSGADPSPAAQSFTMCPAGGCQPPPPAKELRWGMFNVPSGPVPAGYCGDPLTTMTVPVIEFSWQSVEPTDDAWSQTKLNQIRAQYDTYRAAGCDKITLNYGLHHPPTFIETAPNARWIDQVGNVYAGDDSVDLISNKGLRGEAEEYTRKVFEALGPNRPVFEVRIGGSTWGELGYPKRTVLPDGTDTYWVFNALATDNPVPSYRPCSGDPAQARAFADWMLNRVTEFQNWQIASVYASRQFPATHAPIDRVAVLYPGNNMTEAEIDTAVAGNLCSDTVPENDGKFPRGHMFERQVNGVPDGTHITVWGTWANNPNSTNAILDSLADANGFDAAYENSGPGSVTKVQPSENTCRAASSDGPADQDVTCYWIRYGDPGTAEFAQAITTDP